MPVFCMLELSHYLNNINIARHSCKTLLRAKICPFKTGMTYTIHTNNPSPMKVYMTMPPQEGVMSLLHDAYSRGANKGIYPCMNIA